MDLKYISWLLLSGAMVVRGFDVGTWNTLSGVIPERTIGRVTLDETCTNVHAVNTLPIPILCMGGIML